MDPIELINRGMEAEKSGIPVHWNQLCINITNIMLAKIRQLEQQVADLSSESLNAGVDAPVSP